MQGLKYWDLNPKMLLWIQNWDPMNFIGKYLIQREGSDFLTKKNYLRKKILFFLLAHARNDQIRLHLLLQYSNLIAKFLKLNNKWQAGKKGEVKKRFVGKSQTSLAQSILPHFCSRPVEYCNIFTYLLWKLWSSFFWILIKGSPKCFCLKPRKT